MFPVQPEGDVLQRIIEFGAVAESSCLYGTVLGTSAYDRTGTEQKQT